MNKNGTQFEVAILTAWFTDVQSFGLAKCEWLLKPTVLKKLIFSNIYKLTNFFFG